MLVEKSVIEGPYLADVLEQPAALSRVWDRLEDIPLLREPRAGGIVLTGMGSSHHALYPLYLRLIARGLPAHSVETAELIHYQPELLSRETLLVAVSQSGRSAEIVSLMEDCGLAVTVAGVTNDGASPLAASADFLLLLNAGPEATVSCKTYLSSLLALEWLGAVMTGGDLKTTHAELGTAAAAVAEYLAGWKEHVEDLAAVVNGVERVYVTGRGPSLATALTAGLILKESTRFAAEGMSCAAFRHGPLETVGSRVLVLICEGDPKTAGLNRNLARDVHAAGGRVAILGPSSGQRAFRWPEVPAALRPIMEILPVQMLSLALAASVGREAGRFDKATKITDVE